MDERRSYVKGVQSSLHTLISTQNKIIVHYTIDKNPTDTKTLKPYLGNFEQIFGEKIFNKLEEITVYVRLW